MIISVAKLIKLILVLPEQTYSVFFSFKIVSTVSLFKNFNVMSQQMLYGNSKLKLKNMS